MKAIAINTSPEKDKGHVSLLLDPFLEGMRESGADVELYYSRELLIFPCCGNLNCTIRTPGQCMAYDDMRWLRQKIGQADVLVLASPLYFNGRTGKAGTTESVKRLQDQLALCQDLDGEPYGHAIHTTREHVSLRKVVIVSGCGFWEIDGFYPVLTHLKAFCYNTFPELAGCIAGIRGATVRGMLPEGAPDCNITEISRATGRDLVRAWKEHAGPSMTTVACDGRAASPARAPGGWREWNGEIMFESNMKM